MKTKIVYALHETQQYLFMEECWVSAYSLRLFHPEATVILLVDDVTREYIKPLSEFCSLFTEIIEVAVPKHYTRKQRSRELKTKTRMYVDGPMLFLDNDTVICKRLDYFDSLTCDMGCVPETHLSFAEMPFSPLGSVKSIFGVDVSDSQFYFNSGVIYAADNERTHAFFKKWNENWTYSCFQKGNQQDEPSFLMVNREFGNVIQELPGIYNAQVQMSLKYFADAAIVHWWHLEFFDNQNYSPYFSKKIYKDLREAGTITKDIDNMIRNCKQSFASPSMPVGIDQMYFLFSPVGRIFGRIYKDGGVASFLMMKAAKLLGKLYKLTKKK